MFLNYELFVDPVMIEVEFDMKDYCSILRNCDQRGIKSLDDKTDSESN
jgi:hypothetical protein